MYAADEQVIFIAKVHVESRPADICAIKNFLYHDGVIGLLCKEGNECPSQKTLRLLDSAVRMGFVRAGIASASFVEGIDGQRAVFGPIRNTNGVRVLQDTHSMP